LADLILRSSAFMKTSSIPLLALALALGSPLLTSPALAQSAAAPFAAHRAVYDLTLLKSTGASAPASARGRIAFDFSGSACDGFVTTFRQVTEMQPNEGEARTSDMRSTTWEDGPGKVLRFKIETMVNGRLSEVTDGTAQKADDGEALSIDLRSPKRAKQDIATAPLFPTEQARHLVAAAKAGKTTYEAKVFDGSDGGMKIYDTLTVIGAQATTAPSDEALHAGAMASMPRWPVVVSYFEQDKPDGTPNYVLAFDLYENGVSGNLRLDYGDFVLAGKMSKFELMPEKTCK
jgi:hypothetical protein